VKYSKADWVVLYENGSIEVIKGPISSSLINKKMSNWVKLHGAVLTIKEIHLCIVGSERWVNQSWLTET